MNEKRTKSVLGVLALALVASLGCYHVFGSSETRPGESSGLNAVGLPRVEIVGGGTISADTNLLGAELRTNPESKSSRFVIEAQVGTTSTLKAIVRTYIVTGGTAALSSQSTLLLNGGVALTGGTFYGGSAASTVTLAGLRPVTKLTVAGQAVASVPAQSYYETLQLQLGTQSALDRLHVEEWYGGNTMGKGGGGAATSIGGVTASQIATAFGAQTANTFWAAPNGSSGAASFRAIASGDLPAGATVWTRASTTLTPTTANDTVSVPGTGTTSEKFGAGSSAAGARSMALGWNAAVPSTGSDTLVIGPSAGFAGNAVTDKCVLITTGSNLTAATANQSTVIGWNGYSSAPYCTGVGSNTHPTLNWNTLYGAGATDSGLANVIAIGGHVQAQAANQIVMGFDGDYTTLGSSTSLLFNGPQTSPPTFTIYGTPGSGAAVAGGGLRISPGASGDAATAANAVTVLRGAAGTGNAPSTHTIFAANGSLQFGGTTNSFPALRFTSTQFDFVTADQSAFVNIHPAVVILKNSTTLSDGSGSPEGVLAASVGSLYSRTNGASGTTLYSKVSGSGNTGWEAVVTGSGGSGPFTTSGTNILTSSSSYDTLILHSATTSAAVTRTVKAPDGTATANGSALNVLSGAGGATSGASGTLTVASGNTTSGDAGDLNIYTGIPGGGGSSSRVAITCAGAGGDGVVVFATEFIPTRAGIVDLGAGADGWKRLYVDYTNDTTAGTTVTINKASGKFVISATNSTMTCTNSLVTAASHVFCVLESSDATATGVRRVTPSAGSFVCVLTANATANATVSFFVVNAD